MFRPNYNYKKADISDLSSGGNFNCLQPGTKFRLQRSKICEKKLRVAKLSSMINRHLKEMAKPNTIDTIDVLSQIVTETNDKFGNYENYLNFTQSQSQA